MAGSPKTAMAGSTRQGKWKCRGGRQSLRPWRRKRLCERQRRPTSCTRCDVCINTWTCQRGCPSRLPKLHFQLWRRKTGRLEPTMTTRCDACIKAQAEVRAEEVKRQRRTDNFQQRRWKTGIPELRRCTRRDACRVTWPCQGECQSRKKTLHISNFGERKPEASSLRSTHDVMHA